MTALHLTWLASIAGALLFFAAGAVTMALRRRSAATTRFPVEHLDTSLGDGVAAPGEVERLQRALAGSEAALASSRAALATTQAALARTEPMLARERETAAREIEALRARAARAEAAARSASGRDAAGGDAATASSVVGDADAFTREATTLLRETPDPTREATTTLRDQHHATLRHAAPPSARAAASRRELETLRARAAHADTAAREAATLRERLDAATREAAALRERLDAATREATAARDRATAAEATAEAWRRGEQQQLRAELDRARAEALAAARALDEARARMRELDAQATARTETVRDLSTENEHLKGRLRDAEAVRAEYVRLRTTVTEAEFLKREIARLEQELAAMRAASLAAGVSPAAAASASAPASARTGSSGARSSPPAASSPPLSSASPAPSSRAARGTGRPATVPAGTIGESLATVLDRFADGGTRSIAIGDRQGFVIASSGEDALALAAHAAQLAETASRAKQFLPLGSPAALEMVDEHGARVSVWTFAVDGEPLLLASLAVSPPEPARVDAALAELATLLAPTAAPAVAAGGAGRENTVVKNA